MDRIQSYILHDSPLIKGYENVLKKELCNEIIAWGRDRLSPGEVIKNDDATGHVDLGYRNASVANYKGKEFPYYDYICDQISEITGLDKTRFEPLTLTNYTVGQEFKIHQDYFIQIVNNETYMKNTKERCSKGGNRVHTIIIYLNDVEEGGETYFPWLGSVVTPKTGYALQFDYNYDDPAANIRTQHAALRVNKGEKWIITIWVHEKPITEKVLDYRKFEIESEYYNDAKAVTYSLECGPDWDRRKFTIDLPKNDSPMNGIAVGVSGGLESMLLLYLLAVLNSFQKIPYAIIPVMAALDVVDGKPVYNEHFAAVEYLREYLNEILKPVYIRKINGLTPTVKGRKRIISALMKVFGEETEDVKCVRYADIKYLFLGDNERPNDFDPKWGLEFQTERIRSKDPRIIQPFFDLQKYHIADIYVQLKLEKVLEFVGKCANNHKTLTEHCEHFACNERRWGFYKLGQYELGDKYFTNKG